MTVPAVSIAVRAAVRLVPVAVAMTAKGWLRFAARRCQHECGGEP